MTTYLISLSLLIAAVIAVRALFAHSVPRRVIYALWLVVLFRICLPYQIFAVELPSFTVPEQSVSADTTAPAETGSSPVTSDVSPVTSQMIPVIPVTPTVPSETDAPIPSTPELTIAPESILRPIAPSEPTEPEKDIDIPWKAVLCTAWAAGSVIFALTVTVSAMSFALRLKADRRYFMNVKRTKVYISESAGSPMIWGLVPSIYLTPEAAKSDSLSLCIVHEQTHLRHGDHIWSVLRTIALIVFWWDPLVWAAVYLSKQDAEFACDEAIAARLDRDGRIEYANAIVDNIPRKRTLATGLAGAPIKERINMITKKNKTKVVSLCLALILTLGAVGCSFIGPKDPAPQGDDTDRLIANITDELGEDYTQYALGIGADDTVLVSYIGEGSEPLLYGSADGENFQKVEIEIPDTYTYENAEIAYIYPDKVMVELEREGVYTYIEFHIDTDEIFDGVLSADECYFVDYLTAPLDYMKSPCTNFSVSAEIGVGPFAAYVESETAEDIDIYTSKDDDMIASIPWDVIADFPAVEKSEGWLPYNVWYGEIGDFCYAVVAGGVHLGTDNRGFCLSHDGGETWEIGESANTFAGITTSAIFISDQIGLMGYERGAYDGIVIARTTDGGKSWNRVDIEIPYGLSDYTVTTPTSFSDNGSTLTCTISLKGGAGHDTYVDILSSDGGETWKYEENWSGKIGVSNYLVSNSGTREAYFVPAAMYGYRWGTATAYTSYEKNTNSYWTTINARGETDFYVAFGHQNDYKEQGDFDAFTTYHVTARNGRIFEAEIVDSVTKNTVTENGKPYSGELRGEYKTKAFSRGLGLASYSFIFNNGSLSVSVYGEGTDAGGEYNGTYTYDKTSGRLDAQVAFTTFENGNVKVSEPQKLSGRVYEYGGFLHLIVTESELARIAASNSLPLTFKEEERASDFDMMMSILINNALTEDQLAGAAISEDVVRSFITYSCVSYYRENGFVYNGLWEHIYSEGVWYMSAENTARIAYEVFGMKDLDIGEIKVPYGIGLSSGGNGWNVSAITEVQNKEDIVLTCTLTGDGLLQPADKNFGNYRFTFRYITEGERGFWRFIGVEKA